MSALLACTLDDPQRLERLETIAALARQTLISHEQDGCTLRLRYASSAAEVWEQLVAQERECCPFLEFDLSQRPDAVHLLITAPSGAEDFTAVLMSHFLGKATVQAGGCSSSCACGAAS